MFEQKPTIHLAKGMVGVAVSAMLLGTLLIGVTSWKVPGLVIVTYGGLILYLAHHISAAPCLDEPEADAMLTAPHLAQTEGKERLEEHIAETLAKYRA